MNLKQICFAIENGQPEEILNIAFLNKVKQAILDAKPDAGAVSCYRDELLKALGGYLEKYDPSNDIDYDHMADKLSERLASRKARQVPNGCPLGCSDYCKAKVHGCASECQAPEKD